MQLRRRERSEWPKHDAGRGSLDDYAYDLRPQKKDATIRLAGSDPHQDLLGTAAEAQTVETAVPRRTTDEERTDAPMPVRLFVDGRVLGPVGQIPRGLEAVVSEALVRLEEAGSKPRIPVEVVRTRHGLRVDVLIGLTR